MKAIIFSRKSDSVSRTQIDPFFRYRRQLLAAFNFHFRDYPVESLSDIKIDVANKYDIVFIQKKIKQDKPGQLADILKAITVKKIFLDDADSTGIDVSRIAEYFELIDLYVKRQSLRDLSAYEKKYSKNKPHVDLIKKGSFQLPSQSESISFPEAMKCKIFTGWNIGVTAKFANAIGNVSSEALFSQARDIDVSLRIRTDRDVAGDFNYYRTHREQALQALLPLQNRYKIIATKEQVSPNDYVNELGRSKICISPWGFGEVCYRDFEAIISGALLVKPTMEYVATYPDVYVAGQTYISVAPDFGDLAKVCEHYLNHEEERKRIAMNALDAYKKYFDDEEFVKQIGHILQFLGFSEKNFKKDSCMTRFFSYFFS